MDLDELKERYKLLPLWTRLLMMAILGLAPSAFYYTDTGEYLLEDLENAKNGRDGNRSLFEQARSKKGNLPKLEEQMAFTEQQLEEAKKQLPDVFLVEDLLQRLAAIANESGVVLRAFKPDDEPTPGNGDYKYMELGHETNIEGRYNNVAAFLDKVAHLESSVFIKSIEIDREAGQKAALAGANKENNALQRHKDAIASRKNTRVLAKVKMVAYRSMTDVEQTQSVGIEDDDQEEDAKKDNG